MDYREAFDVLENLLHHLERIAGGEYLPQSVSGLAKKHAQALRVALRLEQGSGDEEAWGLSRIGTIPPKPGPEAA